MGALHAGHSSLIAKSVSSVDVTVCSIFVNPTQFGEVADLEKYPKPIEKDIEILIEHGCDILFLPDYSEVYPTDYIHQNFDLMGMDDKIEGASRPGHFQGVCNVIYRFFEIIKPEFAFFGQKDFQQTVVIKRLAELSPTDASIVIVPIKREPHGLAMSSRNIRLTDKGRMNAAFIYKALTQLKEDILEMSLKEAVAKAEQFINSQKGAQIDYLLAVDTTTLNEVQEIDESNSVAVLTVVEYEGVRLLDNIILKE
jgi:pantoate--beta-alanine ligase